MTPVRGKGRFWKTNPYKNWFQKNDRAQGWILSHFGGNRWNYGTLWSPKTQFDRKNTILFVNHEERFGTQIIPEKTHRRKNVILVVNREETLGTLWSPDGNCFFTFHEQIHRFAKKLRYNEMDHVFRSSFWAISRRPVSISCISFPVHFQRPAESGRKISKTHLWKSYRVFSSQKYERRDLDARMVSTENWKGTFLYIGLSR